MKPTPGLVAALVIVLGACGEGAIGTTTTTSTTSAVTSTTPTTTTPTTTTSPARSNPWSALLGRTSSPSGWTVVPCDGDAPLLCVTHDGLTSHVELETLPLGSSGFDELLTVAGAPPATTDLGGASAAPAIMTALRSRAEGADARYAEEMTNEYPDGTAVFEAPVVVPMGRINGVRFASRLEDASGGIIAESIRYLAFDGEELWQITAEFDPRSDDGFSDLATLLDLEPHLTLMARDLAIRPALPGTEVLTRTLPPVGDMAAPWRQVIFVSYGAAEDQLGTTPGGEGGLWNLGPEFGSQGPDGTWWFVDAAKTRLAHFTADGTFLAGVEVPPEYLVRGELFPWRLPHVLDDGTVVTIDREPNGTTFLLWRNGHFSTRHIDESISVKLDDGTALYGLTPAGGIARIDPITGDARLVDWFSTRGGTRFGLWVAANVVTVWLPDAPTPNVLQLELKHGPDPQDRVYVSVEAGAGADGTVSLFLLGGTDSGADGQLGGFLTVTPDGSMSEIETVRGPDIAADPGSPAHLGVSPTTGEPWLMLVDSDGVRVFERNG